jgi:site-specific recombinase XerD
MKLNEVIPDFLMAKEVEEGASIRTVNAYRYDLTMVTREIGDIDVEQVKIIHIRKFLKVIYDKNYTKQGIARKIACLKSFFQFCLDSEFIDKNPMQSIKTPKIRPEEALPKFLSTEDIDRVFYALETQSGFTKAWRSRMKILIRLMYATMARVSEVCGIRLPDLDLDHNTIKVRGKGNKERLIPIDPGTTTLLKEYIAYQMLEHPNVEHSGPLFVNLWGKPLQPRSIQRDLKAMKSLIGFTEEKKFTPHVFRHTGATHLRQNGMDISELQDLLGHANPNTTRIYAKNDLGRLKQSYSQYHPLAKQ